MPATLLEGRNTVNFAASNAKALVCYGVSCGNAQHAKQSSTLGHRKQNRDTETTAQNRAGQKPISCFHPKAKGKFGNIGNGKNGAELFALNADQLKIWNWITLSRVSSAAIPVWRMPKRFVKAATCRSITRKFGITHGLKHISLEVYKSPLIDLEARKRATGRKQAKAVQRERLSEGTRTQCAMRQSEP